jgi:hypothetical protein
MKMIDVVCRVVTVSVLVFGLGYVVYNYTHSQVKQAEVVKPKIIIDEAGNPLTPEQFAQLEQLQQAANDKMTSDYAAGVKKQTDEYIRLAKRDYAIGIVKPNSGNASVASLHKLMLYTPKAI